MRRSFQTARALATVAALSLAATPAAAQSGAMDPQCANASSVVQDACQKSVDLFGLMAPQLGTAIAGGNAVLGRGAAFGRMGQFAIGLRATAFEGVVPDVQSLGTSTDGAQRTDIA